MDAVLAPITTVLGQIMAFVYNYLPSLGVAIILLTLVVMLALFPLTAKQTKSMLAMQQVQPQIKALQAKYKGDKQKLNEEMMKFYRENQINPFASCLPLLAQAPVFISLFYLLQEDLKPHICPNIESYAASINKSVGQVTCGQVPGSTGQSFLFIPDLTAKATGAVLVTLIVLYVGSQLASTLVMMQPTMDKTQRYIMFGLPLFFVVFVINFPAGLLVYWITTNLWTVGQSVVVKKTSPPVDLAGVAVAASTKPLPATSSSAKKKSGGLMNRLLEASASAQEEANARKKEAASGSGGSSKASKKPDSPKPQNSKKSPDSANSADTEGSKSEASSDKGKNAPPPQRNKRKRTGRRR